MKKKNWITVTDPSQVRKLIIPDQTRSPLSRTSVPPSTTDRAPAVALALTAAAAQSDPAENWAPTASADQSDLPEDRASTPAPAPTPAPALQGAPSSAAAAASAPAPTPALASAPARAAATEQAVAPAIDWATVRTSYPSPYKNQHVHLLGKNWLPKCFVLFSFHVVSHDSLC